MTLAVKVALKPIQPTNQPTKYLDQARDYKSFFALNSAEHEISMLDKPRLINLLEELLIYGKFRCFYLSNQTFKFDFSYTHKHQRDFEV